MKKRTKENVHAAFVGEAKAYFRLLAFAEKAEAEEEPQVALLFRAIAEAEKRIAAFAADHIPADVAGRRLVAHGSVYKEIIDAAEAHSVDLIIMGAHRPDLEDYLLGPNAARVVRHSRCSVLVVRS